MLMAGRVYKVKQLMLPSGWGKSYVLNKYQKKGQTRSIDCRGRTLCWDGPSSSEKLKFACDIESSDTNVKDIMTFCNINDSNSFLKTWVHLEVIAKVLNIPIFKYLKKYGFKYEGMWEDSLKTIYLYDDELKMHMCFGVGK